MKAYKCDKCGELFDGKPPTEFTLKEKYAAQRHYIVVLERRVGPDYCPACVRFIVKAGDAR